MPAAYPTDFKINVIRRYKKGESLKLLSEELHIAQSTLYQYQWRKDYGSVETPNRTYTPKEFDAVCPRLRKLEHEIKIVQLSSHLENIPLQKRLSSLEAIYTQRAGQYNIHELCKALGVPRGTFYNYIFRRADRSRHKEEEE